MPKKRAWHHPFPRLRNPDGSETLAGELLRLCDTPQGIPTPYGNYKGKGFDSYELDRRNMLYRLGTLGLIRGALSGPRGGLHHHTTTEGSIHLDLAKQGRKVYETCLKLMHG